MEKPVEVKFRDLEAMNLDDAFEAWQEWPGEEQEQALREAVANYVHAQGLVEFRIKEAQVVVELDSAIAYETARRNLEASGLL